MEHRTLVEKLYQDLKSSDAFIKVTSSGTISIDDEKLTAKNAFPWLQARCRKDPGLNPLLLMEANTFLTVFRMVHSQITRKRPDYKEVEVVNYNYEGLIPFQSVTDSSKYVLFDTQLGTITDLDYQSFKMNKDTARIEPIKARIEFNPYSPRQIDNREDHYGRPCNFLNTYRKPAWQLEREITMQEAGSYKPPKIFLDFLAHLFPDADCQEFVLDWLHFALTDRCETYLVLNGAKGIGKNLFSENFCKPLMGTHNHRLAQPSALDSNFNALLKDCRMIVFDEFRVDTPEKVNKLKRYVNEDQMVEHKGMDVESTIKTYNSFIISNNDAADFKVSWDDRRFSVADLTKLKLQDAWKQEKIQELLDIFQSNEGMRNIGYWIMYRNPKATKFTAFKKRHFYDLCYASFSEWQKCLIDLATSKQYRELTAADLKREYRRRTEATRIPNYNKVKDFVDNYRHLGVQPLGELHRQAADLWALELSHHFASTDAVVTADEVLL